MPLTYDDIPGSWGAYSRGWPSLTFRTADDARRAFIACTKTDLVPYGSYVLCDLELRFEVNEYRERIAAFLDEHSRYSTYASLRQYFIDIGARDK